MQKLMLKKTQSNKNPAQVNTMVDIMVYAFMYIYVSDQNPLLVSRGSKLQLQINI